MRQTKEKNAKQNNINTNKKWFNSDFKVLNDRELETVKGGSWYNPWTWFSEEEESGSGSANGGGVIGGGGGTGGW